MSILTFWQKPTAADRLQSLVDAKRDSFEITEYRIRRAAALRGVAKRKCAA